MTIPLKQIFILFSCVSVLATTSGFSEQVFADQRSGEKKYRKDTRNSGHNKNRRDTRSQGHNINRKDTRSQGHNIYRKDTHSRGHNIYRKNTHSRGHTDNRYEYRRHSRPYVGHRGPGHAVPSHRWHRYRNINVVRHYGPLYRGYGYYFDDSDAYPWLAFTAITLKILDNMNEKQQRAHEAAQVRAAVAPVGEKITWNEGSATGSVTALRDGTSTSGRYCREFQHKVTIGGRSEQAYGTACRQSDGSWEVITSGTP